MDREVRFGLKKKTSFYLTQKPNEKTAAIYLRVAFANQRVRIYTHCRCNRSNWDTKIKRASGGKGKDGINIKLNDYENIVMELFSEYKHYPTVEKLRTDIQARIIMPEKPQTIYEAFDEFIKISKSKNSWKEATVKRVRGCKNQLFTYNPNITFQEITEKELLSFVEYLQGIGNTNVTIQKTVKILKSFLKWAWKEGINKNDEFKNFDMKFKGTSGKANKVIALSLDELTNICNLEIPDNKNYLRQVRDVFVFQCFTGLRHSDVLNLRRHNVKDGFIETVTIKTADRLTIPLNNYSRAILDKYKDINFEDDKALPVISNQRMNEYLKELGELAGLTQKETIVRYVGDKAITTVLPKSEMLSTHFGRRTFVSIGHYFDISYPAMASWTGHSSEAMMSKYRAMDANKAQHEMEKFNIN